MGRTLIVNTNPRSDQYSVNLALACRLASAFEEPYDMIRLYESDQGYFNYQYQEEWMDLLIQGKRLIFPVPMWNLSIPAALKDFFDKVIKRGVVWELDEQNRFAGLLPDRPSYIIMTSGEYYPPGSPNDFVVPYMKAVLNSIGIKSVFDFCIGGVRENAELLKNKVYMDQKIKEMFEAFHMKDDLPVDIR